MILSVEKSELSGSVRIPASKSHTVRAVAVASLAEGTSRIQNPLISSDTRSAADVYRGLGAQIEIGSDWVVRGVCGRPSVPDDVLSVGNSGTTLYMAMGSAALAGGTSIFTGDEQIRSRPAGPLITAIEELGAEAFSTRGNGAPPLLIKGPAKGGRIILDGSKTSQYLSSLLINCPLLEQDTEIEVIRAVETPYIEMTLSWLKSEGIMYKREGFDWFSIPGGQSYPAFSKSIPGDFSSATFFLCAAAVSGSTLTLLGLDMKDSQGDKAVVEMLGAMGAQIEEIPEGIRITGRALCGGDFDLSATPDALPAMAVAACFAEGRTRLGNVAQARLKETDRISVMRQELSKMGAQIEETPDGLVIEGGPLRAARVSGHGDHRIVMALAVAGLMCKGRTKIDTAEAAGITFPNFVELMTGAGADMVLE